MSTVDLYLGVKSFEVVITTEMLLCNVHTFCILCPPKIRKVCLQLNFLGLRDYITNTEEYKRYRMEQQKGYKVIISTWKRVKGAHVYRYLSYW